MRVSHCSVYFVASPNVKVTGAPRHRLPVLSLLPSRSMDILGTLVGGQGCAADGTTAARNPLSRLVDTLMEGSAGSQQKGPPRRAYPPGAGGVMRAPPPPAVAAAQAAQVERMSSGGPHVGEMPMGAIVRPPPAGARWMGHGGPRVVGHHAEPQRFVQVRFNTGSRLRYTSVRGRCYSKAP